MYISYMLSLYTFNAILISYSTCSLNRWNLKASECSAKEDKMCASPLWSLPTNYAQETNCNGVIILTMQNMGWIRSRVKRWSEFGKSETKTKGNQGTWTWSTLIIDIRTMITNFWLELARYVVLLIWSAFVYLKAYNEFVNWCCFQLSIENFSPTSNKMLLLRRKRRSFV